MKVTEKPWPLSFRYNDKARGRFAFIMDLGVIRTFLSDISIEKTSWQFDQLTNDNKK